MCKRIEDTFLKKYSLFKVFLIIKDFEHFVREPLVTTIMNNFFKNVLLHAHVILPALQCADEGVV